MRVSDRSQELSMKKKTEIYLFFQKGKILGGNFPNFSGLMNDSIKTVSP